MSYSDIARLALTPVKSLRLSLMLQVDQEGEILAEEFGFDEEIARVLLPLQSESLFVDGVDLEEVDELCCFREEEMEERLKHRLPLQQRFE